MAAQKRITVLTGFVLFAAVLLIMVGLVNVFQAFVALIADERLVITPENLVVVDVTAWGWILLISGLLLTVVGGGLLAAATWARITAIVIVSLQAITQVAWLGAYPVWALLMIGLDVVILYALTARWSDVRERLGGIGDAPWTGMQSTPMEPSNRTTSERDAPPLV